MSKQPVISVEDSAIDVAGKAIAGLQADGVEIDGRTLHLFSILQQSPPGSHTPGHDWLELASALGLHGPSLLALAQSEEIPKIPLPAGWQQWVLPFGPYTVNSYKIPVAPRQCLLVDAGFQTADFLQQLEQSKDHPVALLLTHGHRDHIGALSELIRRFPHLRVHAMNPSHCRNTAALREGDNFSVEGIQIRVLHTPGHAQDSLCYEIRHAHGAPVAIAAGDTVYARSAGKIPQDYRHSLELLRHKLLSGSPDTLLLPGHGPVTTIRTERECNPFFAG